MKILHKPAADGDEYGVITSDDENSPRIGIKDEDFNAFMTYMADVRGEGSIELQDLQDWMERIKI